MSKQNYSVVNLNNGSSDSGYDCFETASAWAKEYSLETGQIWLVAETDSPKGSINNVIDQNRAMK